LGHALADSQGTASDNAASTEAIRTRPPPLRGPNDISDTGKSPWGRKTILTLGKFRIV
jgi:hypothetical protein